MTCPLNDVRNFKQARKESSMDNVEQIRREAPIASIHHARADEALEVEVVIETESETLTCENMNMKNVNESNNVEPLRQELNSVHEAIQEALKEPKPEAVEFDMKDTTEAQTETITLTDVATRYSTLRRNAIIGQVVGNVGTVAGMVAGAALNGRDIKRAACVSTVLAGVGIGWILASKRQKAIVQSQAEHLDEEVYQLVAENKPSHIAAGFAGAVAVGGVIGAFFIRKVTSSEE